jgi:hypothetical protein
MTGLSTAENWQSGMMEVLRKKIVEIIEGPLIEFTFGNNGRSRSMCRASFPGFLAGSRVDFPVAVVDVEAPLLLGLDLLQRLGLVLCFVTGTAMFKNISDKKISSGKITVWASYDRFPSDCSLERDYHFTIRGEPYRSRFYSDSFGLTRFRDRRACFDVAGP